MPATNYAHTNFTGGELDPRILGRTDLNRYYQGLSKCENFVVQSSGGVKKRPGTIWLQDSREPDLTKNVRLIPFRFSTTQAYVCEFGPLYIRLFTNHAPLKQVDPYTGDGAETDFAYTILVHDATHIVVWVDGVLQTLTTDYTVTDIGVPGGGEVQFVAAPANGAVISIESWVEILTPYDSADIPDLNYTQTGDVLFIVHPDYEPRRLERLSATDWQLTTIQFIPPPSFEADTDLDAILTPSAVTGTDIVFTADTDVFAPADVERDIIFGTSRAVIKVRTSGFIVRADILQDFPDVNPIAAGLWFLNRSPQATATPSKAEPVGASMTITLNISGFRQFVASDIGKFVLINGGIVKILSTTSGLEATCDILSKLDDVTPATAGTWTLEVEAWSAIRGYPRAVTLLDSRLFLAGTYEQPSTVWASQVELFENMGIGIRADDALNFTIASNELNPFLWLVGRKVLIGGTAGEEYIIKGSGIDNPITPTDIKRSSETTYGVHSVRPIPLDSTLLFVPRGRRQVMEFLFSVDQESYQANDLSLASAHLSEPELKEFALAQYPERVLWVITNEGKLRSMTYNRKEQVVAWSSHNFDFGGITTIIDSITTMPNPGWPGETIMEEDANQDELWLSVQITSSSGQRRGIVCMSEQVVTDFSVYLPSITAFPAGGLWAGYPHLNGATVQTVVSTDFSRWYRNLPQVVSGGIVIQTDATVQTFYAGVVYEATAITMPPEIPKMGTIQGLRKKWNKAYARLYKTSGITINDEVFPELVPDGVKELGDDYAPEGFTGIRKITNLGWDNEGLITVKSTLPFPATVLAIFGEVDFGSN